HFHQMPTPLTRRRPDVPAALAALVERMMAKRPDRRYQVPAEVAAALQPYCSSNLPSLPPMMHSKAGAAPTPTPAFPPAPLPGSGAATDAEKTFLNVRGQVVSPPSGHDEVTEKLGQDRTSHPSRRRLVLTVAVAAAVLLPPLLWLIATLGSGSE